MTGGNVKGTLAELRCKKIEIHRGDRKILVGYLAVQFPTQKRQIFADKFWQKQRKLFSSLQPTVSNKQFSVPKQQIILIN